jgi:hypothetical protein
MTQRNVLDLAEMEKLKEAKIVTTELVTELIESVQQIV